MEQIKNYLTALQDSICQAIETQDSKEKFVIDNWKHGSTRVINDGALFERGGVNFSSVSGPKLPSSATEKRPELIGKPFNATGISLVLHPLNPYVPTTHANLRYIEAGDSWWFGGGYDLTPYYPFEEDCRHWHEIAYQACKPYAVYNEYKKNCDEYFFLPHRDETRGIGGLFFDDVNQWEFGKCFEFIKSIGNSFLSAYIPIVEKRKSTKYSEQQRSFQLYRRGRYVEFNLIYDRGTLFGLQSKGRTESILISMPPLARWEYQYVPETKSHEEKLCKEFLKPRDWLSSDI